MKINNLKFGVYNNLQIRINKKMICFCGADNFQLTIREKLNMENQEILNSVLNEFNRFEAIEALELVAPVLQKQRIRLQISIFICL